MPAFVLAITVLALFACGFIYYSRYLSSKVFRLDPAYVTPAHRYEDGVDFVPTNKHVLFGHHFTSVAGAAPIVGPAIAVFWAGCPPSPGSSSAPSSPPASTTWARWRCRCATAPEASAPSPRT